MDPDSAGLPWGLRFCISKTLPFDLEAAGPDPHFE